VSDFNRPRIFTPDPRHARWPGNKRSRAELDRNLRQRSPPVHSGRQRSGSSCAGDPRCDRRLEEPDTCVGRLQDVLDTFAVHAVKLDKRFAEELLQHLQARWVAVEAARTLPATAVAQRCAALTGSARLSHPRAACAPDLRGLRAGRDHRPESRPAGGARTPARSSGARSRACTKRPEPAAVALALDATGANTRAPSVRSSPRCRQRSGSEVIPLPKAGYLPSNSARYSP
jgi:hypothetical protein